MLFKDCELLRGDGRKLHVDVTIRDFREGVSPPANAFASSASADRLPIGFSASVAMGPVFAAWSSRVGAGGAWLRVPCVRGTAQRTHAEASCADGQRRCLDRTFAVPMFLT